MLNLIRRLRWLGAAGTKALTDESTDFHTWQRERDRQREKEREIGEMWDVNISRRICREGEGEKEWERSSMEQHATIVFLWDHRGPQIPTPQNTPSRLFCVHTLSTFTLLNECMRMGSTVSDFPLESVRVSLMNYNASIRAHVRKETNKLTISCWLVLKRCDWFSWQETGIGWLADAKRGGRRRRGVSAEE